VVFSPIALLIPHRKIRAILMEFGRLSGTTLKPHCTLTLNKNGLAGRIVYGISGKIEYFSERIRGGGTSLVEPMNEDGWWPWLRDAEFPEMAETNLPDAASEAGGERRSWREPAPTG
jgi:hypothetical protein